MYNPGRNKVRVYIYDRNQFDERTNEVGELEQHQKLICKDWAEVLPMTGKQFLEFHREETQTTWRLRMRYRKGIEPNDILKLSPNGEKADIIYLSPPINRYMELVIQWMN